MSSLVALGGGGASGRKTLYCEIERGLIVRGEVVCNRFMIKEEGFPS